MLIYERLIHKSQTDFVPHHECDFKWHKMVFDYLPLSNFISGNFLNGNGLTVTHANSRIDVSTAAIPDLCLYLVKWQNRLPENNK